MPRLQRSLLLSYVASGFASHDGAVQLGTHAKVHQLDLSIVSEQHVLPLDVPVDDLAVVQVRQPSEDLSGNVSDPLLLQALPFG